MTAPTKPAATGDRTHYSYQHYADPAVADGFDALRFGGPIRGLEVAHTEQHFGVADAGANLSAYLAATDGRHPPDISPAGVLWWYSLVVLTVVAGALKRWLRSRAKP